MELDDAEKGHERLSSDLQTMTEISVQQRVIGKVTSIFLSPVTEMWQTLSPPWKYFNPPGVLELVTAQSNVRGNQKWGSE